MTLTDCAGLFEREVAWALVREEQIARDNAIADGEDAYRDLARELLPRRKGSARPS